MKMVVAITLSLFATLLPNLLSAAPKSMSSWPVGRYAGTGTKIWEDGRVKTYNVEMTFAPSQISFYYVFEGIQPIDFELKFEFGKEGFFRVGTIGEGYCSADICHWSVNLGAHGVEEWTLFFHKDSLTKVGSLIRDGKKNRWEENLTRISR